MKIEHHNYCNGFRKSYDTHRVTWSVLPALTGMDARCSAFRLLAVKGWAGSVIRKCSASEARGLVWQARRALNNAQVELAQYFTGNLWTCEEHTIMGARHD